MNSPCYTLSQYMDRDQDRQNRNDAELEAAREADSFSFGLKHKFTNTRLEIVMSCKYIDAEKRLAILQGYKDPHIDPITKEFMVTDSTGDVCVHVDYARDNAPAFALMVECGCYPVEDKLNTGAPVIVVKWVAADRFYDRVIVLIADHPSKEAAVRFAIVQAVIAKLESGLRTAILTAK